LYHKDTSPRLSGELPPMWQQEFIWFFSFFQQEFQALEEF
jgi:hypothetical protein